MKIVGSPLIPLGRAFIALDPAGSDPENEGIVFVNDVDEPTAGKRLDFQDLARRARVGEIIDPLPGPPIAMVIDEARALLPHPGGYTEDFRRMLKGIRKPGVAALPALPSTTQFGNLAALMASIGETFRDFAVSITPPPPAYVRPVPPLACRYAFPEHVGCPLLDCDANCQHSPADHAHLRAARTAKLRERRRAIRRNAKHVRKFGRPRRLPKIKISSVDDRADALMYAFDPKS
jgi:hypothetical protein